ncbi:MAG: hypothetical protein J1E95_05600 [Muribaculaceae bacterium]|nr:hypothetical protein [Muribaculaceae bacterium]
MLENNLLITILSGFFIQNQRVYIIKKINIIVPITTGRFISGRNVINKRQIDSTIIKRFKTLLLKNA